MLLKIEFDTGNINFVVGFNVWEQLDFLYLLRRPTIRALAGYSLLVLGVMSVTVSFNGVEKVLELLAVRADASGVIGRLLMLAFSELRTRLYNAPRTL